MPVLHVTRQPICTQGDNIKIALTATLDPTGIEQAGHWWTSLLETGLKFMVLKMAANFFGGYFIPKNGSYTAES